MLDGPCRLLGAQGDDGVDARRSARRPIAGTEHRARQHERSGDDGAADLSAQDRTTSSQRRSPTSSAAPSPTGTPMTTIQPTCFSTIRRTPVGLRTKREPQADLAGAVRDHVREHAVEADAPRAASRRTRASPRRCHEQPIFLHVTTNLRLERAWLHDRQTGIDARDELRHGGQQASGDCAVRT